MYLIAGHNLGYGEDIFMLFSGEMSFPKMTPPVPYLLIILSFITITITFTVMDSNIRVIREEIEENAKRSLERSNLVPINKSFLGYNDG
jgi:hypothetical protein